MKSKTEQVLKVDEAGRVWTPRELRDVERIVAMLLEPMLERGGGEFMSEFAEPLPLLQPPFRLLNNSDELVGSSRLAHKP